MKRSNRRYYTRSLIERIPFVKSLVERRAYYKKMETEKERAMDFVRPYVRGRTFIDVGAHEGAYSFHLVGDAGRVVAFEPIAALAETIRRFNPSVEVYNAAAGDAEGSFHIYVPRVNGVNIFTRCSLSPDANVGFEVESQTVSVRKLDSFSFQNVGAIKIDVEAREIAVIRGAAEVIAESRPVLLVEIEERHHPGQSISIIREICAHGYDAFYIDETGMQMPASNFDFSVLQSLENLPHPLRGGGGLYLNDFFFIPRS